MIFVTGTDTEVGKTFVSCALLRCAADHGSCVGLKPIAAGSEEIDGELRNEDALAMMAAAPTTLPYETINPIALKPPIAPHIALQQAGRTVNVQELAEHCRRAASGFDFALVEGAGGWFVPLNDAETLADLAQALAADVVLVVGMRLGCLNHALLTAAAIAAAELRLAGWVANTVGDPMPYLEENLDTLKQTLAAPCLGVIPHVAQGPEAAAGLLDIGPLL